MDQRRSHEVSGDPVRDIPEPEPAHLQADTDSDDEREATELRTVTRRPGVYRILSPGSTQLRWYDPIKKFWRHHIRLSVPHVDCRDHLGECRPRAPTVGHCQTAHVMRFVSVAIEISSGCNVSRAIPRCSQKATSLHVKCCEKMDSHHIFGENRPHRQTLGRCRPYFKLHVLSSCSWCQVSMPPR